VKRALVLLSLVLFAGLALAITPETVEPGLKRFKAGLAIGTGSAAADRLGARLGGSATVDFAAGYTGVIFSSAITKTGAAVGDICTVSAPAAASALNAKFSCVVTAANEVKVIFEPLSHQRGSATLVSGTPSQVVVASITASSVCTATPVGLTAAIATAGLAVSLTTTNLTITGPDSVTTVVNYECAAPVDPASGTYTFELTRNGT
jgi:hypothetical protein